MRKTIIYVFAVLLPAIIVGVSNFTVFPDSWLPATLMLIVTVGIAAVFTYYSGDATAKVSRYCILADVTICAILCVNLGGHWILAREVSAANQGVTERHVEEDREEKRRADEADRQMKLMDKQAQLQAEERRRLRLLPREERRSTLSAPQAVATVPTVEATPEGKGAASKLTPEQVRNKWWWFLTGLAIAECAASVLAGCILAGIWEWDKNRDGIADHLQQPRRIQQQQEFPDALPTGPLEEPTGKAPRR